MEMDWESLYTAHVSLEASFSKVSDQEVLGINISHTGVMEGWGVWKLNKNFGG
jgi:hypothetical protein